MEDLIEYLYRHGKQVNQDNLFAYLYNEKTNAEDMWYKLSTASRLERGLILQEMESYNVWEIEQC